MVSERAVIDVGPTSVTCRNFVRLALTVKRSVHTSRQLGSCCEETGAASAVPCLLLHSENEHASCEHARLL